METEPVLIKIQIRIPHQRSERVLKFKTFQVSYIFVLFYSYLDGLLISMSEFQVHHRVAELLKLLG